MIRTALSTVALVCTLVSPLAAPGAELAVTANDNKVLLVNGRVTTVQNPRPDTVLSIDGTRIKVNGGAAAIRTIEK